MLKTYRFFASTPASTEDLLEKELITFDALEIKLAVRGVYFTGTIETAYRVCLWSRIANRVLIILNTFKVTKKEHIYHEASGIKWDEHLDVDNTFAVNCTLASTKIINHNHYGALLVKDAIADYFRKLTGKRPDIHKDRPDLLVHLHMDKWESVLSIDLSGESLHKRGYRSARGPATLKENVAAAILLRANWETMAKEGKPFIDPMCGTGTLPIEAGWIAGDIAPGLLRKKYGFIKWKQHRSDIWEKLISEAKERKKEGVQQIPGIYGFDKHPQSVSDAKKNIDRAGLNRHITIEQKSFEVSSFENDSYAHPGLIAVNPPYGQRLGDKKELGPLYKKLGETMVTVFPGWKAALITSEEELAKSTGLKAFKVNKLYNGALKCILAQFEIYSQAERERVRQEAMDRPLSGNTQMFVNRLVKNSKRLKKWIEQEGVTSYRLYDADMPEYKAAIDVYENRWAVVQEYQAPSSIPREDTIRRLNEIKKGVTHYLGISQRELFIKQRKKQSGKNQYEKKGTSGQFYEMQENGLKFLVNFDDYLDTGIFLDHRLTRALIEKMAKGADFLNLFAYTGTATVYAARGEARTTTTVDKSATYLDWAKKNLSLNHFKGVKHQFIKKDCLAFLESDQKRYDLIFLDPPTFSNSKEMENSFDIQNDHVSLIHQAAQRLKPEGKLLFSNNFQKFKLDTESLADMEINEITQDTIPPDFIRNPKIHRCWTIKRK
jgi:23S rRNA (guanine2445-N2)-methyltransferase / 23S rRNA (guanine2069-N7)-methyltransferase